MDVTTFNMAGSHSPAEQFRPTKAISFPKRQFGCKGDQRSFHAERCDTLSRLHYTMSMQTQISATSVAMHDAVILHVRKLQSYCSLRAGEADPRPSNFVSTTDFKQKARFGSKFLLFPQLNYYAISSPDCTRNDLRRSEIQNIFLGACPRHPRGCLARSFLPAGPTESCFLQACKVPHFDGRAAVCRLVKHRNSRIAATFA